MPLESFSPVVREWFRATLGEPSAPQRAGWPLIMSGSHALIAAPTGTGKTLAAFLWAIDDLLREGDALAEETRVLYISPLKALGNDVRINLLRPLEELRRLDPGLPEVRVTVRSGDTPPSERAAMRRRPPHILVTTPESLYILLTSEGGRSMLGSVRTVIVDEIHALAGNKRGAHLALSLERLEALTERPPQRIGLSATQKPMETVARLLAGEGRQCAIADAGHRRTMDLSVEVPGSPLGTVCSDETWDEIFGRMATLIENHASTLVFVNTRKMAERVSARLATRLGAALVTSHHGSLSRERRLDAERRLKAGELRALVATASLELGIDIGDVDLVIQAGVTPSIATLLQRVGRAGHGLDRIPRGVIFPLTRDELACAAGLLHAVQRGELDRTPDPQGPLDILAQQVVAACVAETWDEDALFARMKQAHPYRDLAREDFDAIVTLHTQGRQALLHRDGVQGRLRATRRARLTAITSGGAIPDTADYRVILQPEESLIGTINEDFAVEAGVGDVFQLGNASWRILKVEPGTVRVADARGAPPSLPFWLGEAPARTRELSSELSVIRQRGDDPAWRGAIAGFGSEPSGQLSGYIAAGRRALGAVPTRELVIAERFFDESGGMQLVIHALFGGRINRAWGLALRKRFCRGFGFELQAAANEEAILLSLGPQHSFPLEDVFGYLQPETARAVLVQALLASPLFATRWRWNVTRSLLLPRTRNGGKRVPAPLVRMRADDLLAAAFPEVLACGETLPPGDLPVPWEQPIVRQTIEDCLTEAMDIDGFLEVLEGIRSGRIATLAVDTPEPSPFALGILNAMPYAFLDDAPLEERRAQAVISRRGLDPERADSIGALDPAAVERVREEAWPQPVDAEELHEALLWMGYATEGEAASSGWMDWLEELSRAGRVSRESGRWMATEADRRPAELLGGRLEALGPVFPGEEGQHGLDLREEEHLLELERRGRILRCRIGGRQAWCDRRLLGRIQRYTLDRLRSEIAPVSAAAFWHFLAGWQHAAPGARLEGPAGVAEVIRTLAGFEAPAAAWESSILPSRVKGYRPEWLDGIMLTGEAAWLRLWGEGGPAPRSTPLSIVPGEDLDRWLALRPAPGPVAAFPSAHGRALLEILQRRGALFTRELAREAGPLTDHLEMGLAELIGLGRITCDSFGGLRLLLKSRSGQRRDPARPRSARHATAAPQGRWSLVAPRAERAGGAGGDREEDELAEFAARSLLQRYGVVFRRILTRERIPVPWWKMLRRLRLLELRGDVRGGRFVGGFPGEQYALPAAVSALRRASREERAGEPLHVGAADPLNLGGVLTPEERVSSTARRKVVVG